MHKFMLSLVSGATLIASASWVTLSAQNDTVGVHGVVTTVPAGGLIRKPANFFDLEGTTVTFTPNDAGEYAVTVGNLDWRDPASGAETVGPLPGWHGHLTVDLPFSFPFAGQTWTRVYANADGNISFQRPEQMNWPHRSTWADATMRSVAAAIDSRSAAGLETMIAALWTDYGDTTISVDSTPDRVVITWQAVRPTPHNEAGHEPLGENLFQARLYPSGVIELAYRTVAERDGIVGLFHGLSIRGRTLDSFDDPAGDVENPALDIVRIEFIDNDSTVLARMTLVGDVPAMMHDGAISYRIFLRLGGTECAAGIVVGASGWRPILDGCVVPKAVGYRVDGTTIEIPISKTLLNGSDRFSWDADAVWWGREFDQLFEDRTVYVGESDRDLRELAGTTSGNLFEVFHYPTMPKWIDKVLSFVHERVPADAEIAVAFTDFRIDDLYGTGAGTGPINAPVQGIGVGQANANRGKRYGSDHLLVSMAPVFIGTPTFGYTNVSNGHALHNYAPAIGWIAHEAVHRWAAHLDFRNPRSGRVESLTNGGVHWNIYLHTPVAYPVWPGYSTEPYPEDSLMGGNVWKDNGDGTFTRQSARVWPSGLSALDLYVMGMIPPNEVPETFILRDVQETDRWDTVRATKVPVRIEDIVAAMGPRVPAADVSQKEFRLGVYLLHEDGRPPRADLLERAQAITAAIPEYFAAATGGRMRVVPTVTPPMTGLVVPGGSESFSIPNLGGQSITSNGTERTTQVGYGRIGADAGSTTPSGIAIFGYNPAGTLISEAGVPAAEAVRQGRIFAEVNGPVNTGLAMANPNDAPATIAFYFTGTEGQRFGEGSFELGAREQTARFLNETPFNGGDTVLGTFTFAASQPIAVIALRGLTNRDGEFLMTTLPVAPLVPPPTPFSTTPTGTVYFPHFADGNGWATQVILVNPTDRTITGTAGFLGPGSGTVPASPVVLALDDGRTGSDFAYSIAPRSAQRFTTSNPSGGVSSGSVRATPNGGTAAPSGLVIFSHAQDGKTVSEAGVPTLPEGTAFRFYVESSGMPEQIGSIRTGLAITNAAGTANTVTLEVTGLDGTLVTGVDPVTLPLPPSGQVARFIDEFFDSLPPNFSGVLRVTSTADVAIVGLRLRYNDRGELKMTTTPPSIETGPPTMADRFFPHIVDSAGWSTQFILFSGTAGEASSGTLSYFDTAGAPWDLPTENGVSEGSASPD